MTHPFGKTQKQVFGKEGEVIAAIYLEKQGYVIVVSNYKKFFGEIDLIAKRDSTLIFVEVKSRKNDFIALEALISPIKRERIIKTAKSFISEHKITNMILRFDVILIKKNNEHIQCDHIESAFLSDE